MLITILGTVLTDGIKLRLPYDDYCAINVPEPFKKMYKFLDRLFRDAYSFIVTEDHTSSLRFVTRIGGSFVAITRDGNKVTLSKQANLLTLLALHDTVTQKKRWHTTSTATTRRYSS